jgi:hypothetical protein
LSNEPKTTHQIDLSGNVVEIEKEVIIKTSVKYYAPQFVLTVSEANLEKLNTMRDKGEVRNIKGWIACHQRPRFEKLPDGKEGEAFAESIQIFEKALWMEKLWLGNATATVTKPAPANTAGAGGV